MDLSTLLYAPIYATFGVPATLTPNRPGATGTAVTVIERTERLDASEAFELGTLRRGACVRRSEHAAAGIAPAELDGGTVDFAGQSWRIDAHAPRPGPDGEATGEVLMLLADDGDG